MKVVVKIFGVILYSLFLLYLLLPSSPFPKPPHDSIQSLEPADIESPQRRAYFTNFTREEIMHHYINEYGQNFRLVKQFVPLRLNYPPEEAQLVIRDQTRSSFLEELAYPFRESIYINGFEPKDPKDDIWYEGKHYRQKIIIKIVPSGFTRVIVGLVAGLLLYFIYRQYSGELRIWRK